MRTVRQPSALPTNKLTAAMVSASAAGIVKALVVHNFPDFADPAIWEPLPYLVGGLVGYFVKDTPNV
ncbi:MAG: hypothetical protein EOQ39_22350 [Mesorhizobium sp.]|uniref:hypothetical protein n=1 Tax=Mesorhizobium sp. TaxID=1871066 RepID=UPI000FE70FF4|nr:hypothetical protein [Mesorhizobium sp.]RWB05479.1 MAG: hypothetical protein EOQ37_14560 [Mesorhizobium sp.]RWB12550.1 MAG: hypothetical protein EOQ39_22350 [Mesorhizobium sp.]